MRDHKSLKAWVEARNICLAVLRASRLYWTPHAAELFRQLQRSALSIQLNIAEGHALGDRGRFGNHLAVAYGSATETSELLELALQDGILPQEVAEPLLNSTHQCERLLVGLLKRYRPLTSKR
jgi:four helix bundle protein